MLKKRGGYLSRHLRKIESDFLKKYSSGDGQHREFLRDVKVMFDIYEVLVGGTCSCQLRNPRRSVVHRT